MIALDSSVVIACGAELVTLDRRALTNYERCGVAVRLLA